VTAAVPSGRQVWALALPALGALAADPLLSLVDTAFVGRLGATELAALGVDTAIFSFAFAAFNFLAYATTPMVARARGRGDLAEAGLIVRRARTLALLIGMASTVVLIAAAGVVVRLMQAAPDVVDPAVTYLRIRALALPALLVITAAHGAYRGMQDTRTPLVVTLAVNALNAILDPVLMFGMGLGLAGAAVATVAAQTVGAVVFLELLRRRAVSEGWPDRRIRLRELTVFLAVGSALVARTVLLVTSLAMATAVAARVGTVEVAAHQVVSQLWFLLAMIIDALAIAAQAMVADLLGRGSPEAARTLSDRLVVWGAVGGVGLGLALWVGGSALAALFTTDRAVRSAIVSVTPIAGGMQPVAAVLFVLDGVFLAMLAVRRLVASTAAGFVATVTVLAITLAFGGGLAGVWWAVTAMVVARLAVLAQAYRSPRTWARS
jgi:putative MATE family efflux protein